MSAGDPSHEGPSGKRRLPVAERFSPFERGDDARIQQALGALFGHETLRWSDRTPELQRRLGQLTVSATFDGVEIEMELGDGAQEASTAVLRFRRLADGSHPAAHAVAGPAMRALTEAFRSGVQRGVLDSLAQAIATHRKHNDVPDWQYRRIMQSSGGLSGMLRLGFRCNQDCSFCWQGRDWPSPPTQTYFDWLDEFAAQGISYLTISGGEPTLAKFLPDLIERAHSEHSMTVHLQTNAIRLRDPRYCAKLTAAGLASVLVSFHSADADISDTMTRAPGTHGRTVLGIHRALDAGLLVVLNCVVDQQNHASLAEHAAFIAAQFVQGHEANPVRTVNYSHPSRYYEQEAWAQGLTPFDELRDQLVGAVRILSVAGVSVHVTGSCGFPPCLFRDEPELIPWLGAEDLDGRDLSARRFSGVCEGCAARAYCPGLRREYLDTFGHRGVVPYETLPAVASEQQVPKAMHAVRTLEIEQR